MAASKSSRATKFRKNREARGFKSISVTISPEAKKALETLQVTRDWAQWEAVSEALIYAAQHLAGFVPPAGSVSEAASASSHISSTASPEREAQSVERARETEELLAMKKLILGFEERMGEMERRLRESGDAAAGSTSATSVSASGPASATVSGSAAKATVKTSAPAFSSKPASGTTANTSPSATATEGAADVSAYDRPGDRAGEEGAAKARKVGEAASGDETSSEAVMVETAMSGPDEEAILDFAAQAFREHGMTISRGRTYRMAQQQGIRVHESEEEYGRFLQSNLAEISRRLKILMAQGA